jgi:hypothetical protein
MELPPVYVTADSIRLFDRLVGEREQRWGHFDAECYVVVATAPQSNL